MRIGFLVEQMLAPVPGGTGRYSAELAAALARTADPGDGVVGWCAFRRDVSGAAVPGVLGPLRLGLPRRALAAAWARGVGPIPGGVDVVHAPTLLVPPRGLEALPPGVRHAATAWRRTATGRHGDADPRSRTLIGSRLDGRSRLVVTVHDAVPWTHPETLTPHGVRWHREMGERVAREADAVIVPTQAVAADVREHLPIDPERLHVIGEGVADAVLRVPADADRRAARLGLPERGYLLTLATMEPRKGLDTALAAMRHPAAPDLPLVHVGAAGWGDLGAGTAGPGGFAELAAAGRFRALGRISDEDLAVVLSRATALLAPSRSEGFGLPVIEAMAHGVPVVVSDTPALVEVAGDAALVARIGDAAGFAEALGRIVQNPRLHSRLSRSGLLRAAGFTWNEAARSCWELYRRISSSPAVSVADDGRA
ncbi:Glycosyltransferase involved in cell wall bisynthesis [Parafrankia irregularis]|uniref:Glycosyltransferase involved in cell wall bisynthesis n=1 Tax=Parafrankia irregularis TaxID=795642 RepID=A0A0S4QG96_9ACTN|nr:MULTISPECIES: glycosyltransferase family 1 protein [Parafrankia]MBE3202880.1 glycosyltransferase family 4 protein [Parafrankia sp. CH37]CUU54493.1 Glycosyltransferase involved in cell wall bisynthesis [Parafrankia irregularis]